MNSRIKNIFSSIMVIGIAASLLSTGTFSYFSDDEVNPGILHAGIIDIELDPDEPQSVTTLEGHLDLKPCQTGYIEVRIYNNGTNPCKVWKRVVDVENHENGINGPEQDYYNEYPESEDLNISDYIHYDLAVNGTWIITEDMGYTLTGGSIWTGIEGSWMYLGIIEPEQHMLVNQSYHLNYTVENWGQSDEVTFDMEFQAKQVNECGRECREETAWGGDSEGSGSAWWFYFDTSGEETQAIWAGQHHDAGNVTVEKDNGDTTIFIEFAEGWELQDVEESVKIQGYDEVPDSKPSPGLFTTYKGEELTVTVESFDFYCIHLDVQYCSE